MTLLTTENVFLEFSHVLEALEEHLQDVQLPLGSPTKINIVIQFGIILILVRRDETPRTNSAEIDEK